MNTKIAAQSIAFLGILAILLLGAAFFAGAQESSLISATVARTYDIVDASAEPGDIVAFDEANKTHRLARSGDVELVGVIVSNPLIVLEVSSGGTPVVQTGETLVNVSTIGGVISVGDAISASPIPGKGARAKSGDQSLGVARESFTVASSTITIEGNEISVGTIRVLLGGTQAGLLRDETEPTQPPVPGGPVPQAVKYVMALLIGVGSVYFAFKNFGANIRSGILSIGRNPLAKTTIQAMVILNIVLIILVAGGGLLLSIAILLLPF